MSRAKPVVMLLNEETSASHAASCLNRKQLACMNIPNTPMHIDAMKWMEQYFEISGDYQPNSNEEIHLDPIKKREIHGEYVKSVVADKIVTGETSLEPAIIPIIVFQ